MVDNETFAANLAGWVNKWRGEQKNIPEIDYIYDVDTNEMIEKRHILNGEELEKFVADLQNEINLRISDFGENSIGPNAQLVLYSGVNPEGVEQFCAN